MTSDYTITVEIRGTRKPTMQNLVDAVADELERLEISEHDYEIVCKGPPELSIGVRFR